MSDLTVPKLQSILPEVERTGQASGRTPSSSFSDFVKRSLADVNRQVNHADQAVGDLATGKNQDIHNTMIAMQKAEISFELMLQIRNKLITAYDEIRRMSI